MRKGVLFVRMILSLDSIGNKVGFKFWKQSLIPLCPSAYDEFCVCCRIIGAGLILKYGRACCGYTFYAPCHCIDSTIPLEEASGYSTKWRTWGRKSGVILCFLCIISLFNGMIQVLGPSLLLKIYILHMFLLYWIPRFILLNNFELRVFIYFIYYLVGKKI